MAEGGSFLNPGVGEPSRRAFLDVDKRVKAAQDDAASALAQIAALSPDHGSLLGLGDDDHSQYHNDARGDARYYTQSQVDSSLTGKSDTSHTHSYAPTSHVHSYLPLTGGTVTGQTTFSATDGVKLTGSSGGVWFDDRNGDGSKYVLYHDGDFFGIWDGVNTHHKFYNSGRMDISEGGDNNYIYFGPNGTWGGQLYVGATSDKAGTNTAAVISTDGNLHLDAGNSKSMYLNYYTQGASINLYGPVGSSYDATFASVTANNNIYLRSANGVHDSIYRVGGIYFTWDSDSYGTNPQHSIRSTDGDSWSDDITINSYGNVRVNIDTNNNGGNAFYLQSHGTGTGNILLYVPDTGAGIYLQQGWYRSPGNNGWYSETHGGGIHMQDSTWVRTYNGKRYYSDQETAGYTVAAHGGLIIGGEYGKSAFNSTYARRHCIQMEVDTTWGGHHPSHTGALIWCGNMNAGAWGTAELGFRTSNNWGSYYSANPLRMKGTRAYANLSVETALNIHSDGAGRLGYYSSRRELKNLVEEIPAEKSLARIMQLQPIDFTWKPEYRPTLDDTSLIDFDVQRGFYAEDAAAVDRSYGAWGWLYRSEDGEDDEDFTGEPLTESLLKTTQQLEDAVVVSYNDKAILADLVGSVHALNARIMELEALSGVA